MKANGFSFDCSLYVYKNGSTTPILFASSSDLSFRVPVSYFWPAPPRELCPDPTKVPQKFYAKLFIKRAGTSTALEYSSNTIEVITDLTMP